MELVVRITVIYLAIVVGLRVVGKREFGQLSPLELVTLLLIPEIVSPAATRNDASLTGGLVGAATILSLAFITSAVTHRFKRVERLSMGEPALLVANGRLIEKNMNQQRVSAEEIVSEAQKVGLADLSQVKWALLETDGRIAIVPKSPNEMHQRPPPDPVH